MIKQPTPGQVSGCVGFRLRKLSRRVSQVYDQMLTPLDLTGTQFSLLSNLATSPGLAIGELADRLMMDPTTLTRTLRPLERSTSCLPGWCKCRCWPRGGSHSRE